MKIIAIKILLLIKEIALFWISVIRKIVFPWKEKKGNILSTIFDLFIGTIEKLESFEHGVFRMTSISRQRHIKQGLFVFTFLLFLLSSFEYEGEKQSYNNSGQNTVQLSQTNVNEITYINKLQNVIGSLGTTSLIKEYSVNENTLQICSSPVSSLKTYLLINCFRI